MQLETWVDNASCLDASRGIEAQSAITLSLGVRIMLARFSCLFSMMLLTLPHTLIAAVGPRDDTGPMIRRYYTRSR